MRQNFFSRVCNLIIQKKDTFCYFDVTFLHQTEDAQVQSLLGLIICVSPAQWTIPDIYNIYSLLSPST